MDNANTHNVYLCNLECITSRAFTHCLTHTHTVPNLMHSLLKVCVHVGASHHLITTLYPVLHSCLEENPIKLFKH